MRFIFIWGGQIMKALALTIAGLCLSACTTFEPPFQSASVHYNRVVADTNNELIFLNIIRAKDREPMYFTAVSQMRGSLTLSGTSALSAEYPESGAVVTDTFDSDGAITAMSKQATASVRKLSPSISATIATNPSFDYQVLDTQEFYNGILTSISPSTLASYLRQGWRDDLLTALVVEKVEFSEFQEGTNTLGKPFATLINSPSNKSGANFGEFIRCFETQPNSLLPVERKLFNLADIEKPSLSQLPDLKKAGYSIDEKNNVVYSVSRPDGLRVSPRDSLHPSCVSFLSHLEFTEPQAERALRRDEKSTEKVGSESVSGTGFLVRNNLAITYTLRSTQSIIYFLGEYLREESEAYTLSTGPIFEALTEKPSSTFSKTELNGKTYWIATAQERSGSNTLSTMAFLNQMINLQKSADERPATAIVQSVR
jgi:hypothetical protein